MPSFVLKGSVGSVRRLSLTYRCGCPFIRLTALMTCTFCVSAFDVPVLSLCTPLVNFYCICLHIFLVQERRTGQTTRPSFILEPTIPRYLCSVTWEGWCVELGQQSKCPS